MSNIDHLDLDGHALRLLVTVAEEGSITRASLRLGLTQSAVSHALDRLRAITGDALFVRSGRGIVATAQAALLVQRAERLLDELRAFSLAAGFDPVRLTGTLTVAANDLQRDLLLPTLLRRLRAQAPRLTMRILPSGAPEPALLRDGGCDLLITPRPPAGSDILQKRLFEDRYAVFYDADARSAPGSMPAYLAAEHVSVLYAPGRALEIDGWLAAQGVQRRLVATVPGFAGIAALLRGGPWLATLPSQLGAGVLRGLAQAPLPLATPPMAMYMVWHQRQQGDPAHQWLRSELEQVARQVPAPRATGAGAAPRLRRAADAPPRR